MVEDQIKARGIRSREVLDAMRKVPRHLFVDEAFSSRAYNDAPLPIGHGQTISQPYMVALMTEALCLSPDDKVLEIGFGSGYQTAVLSMLCKNVYAVERIPALFDKGRGNLMKVGVKNAFLKLDDGKLGWQDQAPFEAILVAAFGRAVPEALRNQLAPGGKLIMPVGNAEWQHLMLYSKDAMGRVSSESLAGCRFVPLVEGKKQGPREG
jgi:protein-L-isoaspartate(D-aspartate) O-methyltransferase